MEEKTPQKSRTGSTSVTSVSVSQTFQRLVEENKLSPTEVYRRGVGVMLYDLGISPYSNSKINEKRSAFVKDFLKKIDQDEEMREQFEKIEKFNEIRLILGKLKSLVGEINGSENN